MPGTPLTFAGNDLQTATIVTEDIDVASIPDKVLKMYALANANKSVISDKANYPGREINIRGSMNAATISAMDSLEDTFKAYFRDNDQNLDKGHAGGTRRFTASLNKCIIRRPGGLAFAEFELGFICTDPFGRDTSTTSALSATGRTLGTYSDNHTFLGTAPYQLPIATITYALATVSATNLCTNPGFEVNTTSWSALALGNGSTIARATTQFHSGVASLQMNCTTLSLGSTGGAQYAISGLTVGQNYTIDFWMRGFGGGEGVAWSVDGVSQVGSPTLTTSWVQRVIQFTATATTATFAVMGKTVGAVFYLDDVNLVANGPQSVMWGNDGNGQAISITRLWSPLDVLVIDCSARTVKVNGIEVAFAGGFPEFPPGSQPMGYTDEFVTRQFDISVVYTAGYL